MEITTSAKKARLRIVLSNNLSVYSWMSVNVGEMLSCRYIHPLILLHKKFLQFDWLRAVVYQLNLKYLHVKITNRLHARKPFAGSTINKTTA